MEILERILAQNPWWEGRSAEAVKGMEKRDAFGEIEKYMKTKQILSITGLRRVGKTVLVKQVIESLLQSGVEPKRVLYFSFDEILARNPDIIEDVLRAYETNVLKSDMKGVYIFFDEISCIPMWQVMLKRFYDMEKVIKFVVTGSSGVELKKSSESLAGRMFEFHLDPLSFREFLRMRKISVTENPDIHSLTLQKELSRYLMTGGFPEIVNEIIFEKAKMYVNSIVDKVVFSDIPKIYNIANPEILDQVFRLIALSPGNVFEYGNIASSLKVSYQTVSKYVHHLESAYLIRSIYNKRGSPVAMSRKSKKIYLTTTSLSLAALDSESQFLSIMPKIAENAVAVHSKARHFWREYYEIDFIGEKCPIEVKYSGHTDISNNLKAALKIKAKSLLVITKNHESTEKKEGIKIRYIPLWKWLLG